MSADVVRQFTVAQCEAGRAEIVSAMMPMVQRAFADHPGIQSAVLMVGQFWADEALDAVHGALCYSVSRDPDINAYARASERMYNELLGDADMDALDEQMSAYSTWIEGPLAEAQLGGVWTADRRFDFNESYVDFWRAVDWDSNGDAIPLFATFCVEGADQEQPTGLSHAPYCIFRRAADGGVSVDVVGVKARPWLEGVAPQGID
jgi:hypothetical protein